MIDSMSRLASVLSAAGIPIDGVSSGPPIRVDYQTGATPAQIAQGAAIVAAFDPAAGATWAAQQAKAAAALSIDAGALQGGAMIDRLVRALALVVLDEVNILRTGASLAPRTTAQLVSAIKAKIAATAE